MQARDDGTAAIKAVVKEAMQEAMREARFIDDATHMAHHQAIAEFLSLAKHAKKTFVGALVMGIFSLLMLGLAAWKGQ